MKKLITLCVLAVLASCGRTSAPRPVEIGEGYSGTSVNTTIFRCNSAASYKDYQFVGYYDSTGTVVLGRRKLGSSKWELHRTQYTGNVADAHNVISLMVDGDGYLHMSFDQHAGKLKYCTGTAPLSLEMGELKPMIGTEEEKVTYPEFHRLSCGDLLFVYRSGSSGNGNMVMNRYRLSTGQWERVQTSLVDGEGLRNAYWQMFVDANDVIHLSWVWRETSSVSTNHDLCYAKSEDCGKTWTTSSGKEYKMPIDASNAEYAFRIPQASELINQTSMCADREGHPYIATYWRSEDSDVPQYRLVWHDGNEWKMQCVSKRTTPFSLDGPGTKRIPISRPKVVICGNTMYYLYRDVESGSRASMYYTGLDSVESGIWERTDITDFPVNCWEPTVDNTLLPEGKLHVFVQFSEQGDGEKTVRTGPHMAYIYEMPNP